MGDRLVASEARVRTQLFLAHQLVRRLVLVADNLFNDKTVRLKSVKVRVCRRSNTGSVRRGSIHQCSATSYWRLDAIERCLQSQCRPLASVERKE